MKNKKVVRIFNKKDWGNYYGLTEKLDPEIEDVMYSSCPFNKGKMVLETHFAFVGIPALNGIPLTVARWLQLHPEKFYHNINPWHTSQPHTDIVTLEPRLYIVLREIVPGSTGKTPEEQVAMLPPEYEVPTTITEVTKDILVYRRTGKRSNPKVWAICSERTAQTSQFRAGRISGAGYFFDHGLIVDSWGGDRDDDVGVGASRILKLG